MLCFYYVFCTTLKYEYEGVGGWICLEEYNWGGSLMSNVLTINYLISMIECFLWYDYIILTQSKETEWSTYMYSFIWFHRQMFEGGKVLLADKETESN